MEVYPCRDILLSILNEADCESSRMVWFFLLHRCFSGLPIPKSIQLDKEFLDRRHTLVWKILHAWLSYWKLRLCMRVNFSCPIIDRRWSSGRFYEWQRHTAGYTWRIWDMSAESIMVFCAIYDSCDTYRVVQTPGVSLTISKRDFIWRVYSVNDWVRLWFYCEYNLHLTEKCADTG